MGRECRCVECGYRVKSLFVQYSPGNIRLMKCERCKEVADEYIECELMIVFIDLVLHKPKAYRHVLYNVLNKKAVNIQHLLWKAVFANLLIDAYRSLLLRRNYEKTSLSHSFVSTVVKVMIDILSANIVFICSFALAAKIMLHLSFDGTRKREILLGILISSYFKIFLLAMMVWEFPASVIFIVDIFVLTSNCVALKVMAEPSTGKCIAVCFIAHLVRLLALQLRESRSLGHFDL
ncbi:PREDICTED: protein arv1 homolog [Tarenaya hassleriana]|uniref:protein arv1 homolog n=1 Tax=Tarenaya hassleriana TaxID=28532 RepID=UPI00053C52E3|nr:PREDICTED: protein arv1 homolog [Tarenaya hassleriana]